MDTEQTNLSLEQVAGVLRRRAPWILLCAVLVTAAAYGFSKHQTKQYTATASLVFSNNQLGQQVAGLAVASSTSQQAQENTNLKLVKLGDMAAKTAAVLGLGLTKQKVSANLSVSGEGESNIVNVSATATSPELAASIANTYSKLFVTEQQNSNHAYYASALALVNRQLAVLSPQQRAGTAGLALEDRAQSLGTLAELRNGNVQVAQTATVPSTPSSPMVSRNAFLGAVVGSSSRSCSSALTGASGSRRIWRRSTVCRCSGSSPRALRCLVRQEARRTSERPCQRARPRRFI